MVQREKGIFKIFKKKHIHEQTAQAEMQACINYIYNYTEIHGVRETTRRLNNTGYRISAPTISEVRNNISDYGYNGIIELAEAISKLEREESEKKS